MCAKDVQFWQSWPSHQLSSSSSELIGPEESENDGTVLTADFREALVKLWEKGSSDQTIADIRNWAAGDEEENLQIMTEEEIISNVLQDDNSENEKESSTPPIIGTVWQDDTMSVFNTCWKQRATWRQPHVENIGRKILKEAFRNKRQKTIEAFFFVKMPWN
jgi:hypothetical protein